MPSPNPSEQIAAIQTRIIVDLRMKSIRTFCESNMVHDAGKADGGLTDRAWACQCILNILDGLIDEQLLEDP